MNVECLILTVFFFFFLIHLQLFCELRVSKVNCVQRNGK